MAKKWLSFALVTAVLWALWAEDRARREWKRGERYLRLLKGIVQQ